MLHIVSNESVAGSLRHSGVPGEVVAPVLAELHAGPAPAGVSGQEWLAARTRFVADLWGVDAPGMEDLLAYEEQKLQKCGGHDEAVLWFAAGLENQVQMIRIIDWIAGQDLGAGCVSLICVGEISRQRRPPWPIYSLGVMDPGELAALFPSRHEVSAEEYRLARDAWVAYRAPDPTAIVALLRRDTSALPYLQGALVRHLQEYPSTRNGLRRTEHEGLALVPARPTKLAIVVGDLLGHMRDSWFGDTYLTWCMEGLAHGASPAVEFVGPGPRAPGAHEWEVVGMRAMIRITPFGREVLAGRADWVRANGIDRWLGGVHLQGGEAAWRWDEERRQLVAC